MKIIREFLKLKKYYFNGKELNKSINAEEVYSYGATIQDHILKVDKSLDHFYYFFLNFAKKKICQKLNFIKFSIFDA